MKTFPNAKINLGLNVVRRRPDGYHDLQTVFYPVPLCDVLEAEEAGSGCGCTLETENIPILGASQDNLVVRAYNILKHDFPDLPAVRARLTKNIPTQAGMGGGSSDAAFMLRMLNEMFGLGLSVSQLIAYAARLGADCPFFILNRPAYAEGIGERISEISLSLKGWSMVIVKPDTAVSTKEAFSLVSPREPLRCCREIVKEPVETWDGLLTNDFEQSVFALHADIASIKNRLMSLGAAYATMSGSGSAVVGLFRDVPPLQGEFEGCFCRVLQ